MLTHIILYKLTLSYYILVIHIFKSNAFLRGIREITKINHITDGAPMLQTQIHQLGFYLIGSLIYQIDTYLVGLNQDYQ